MMNLQMYVTRCLKLTFVYTLSRFLLQDFGKYPFMRKLLQDYIKALDYHSDAEEALKQFVAR